MIKAKVKNAPKWKEYKTCSLGISLQSPNHVGEKLAAMVDWVNSTGHFERCVVDLSDTLHRHNLSVLHNVPLAAAHKMAADLGNEWLDSNRKILDQLDIPCEVVRWDHWLPHADLAANRKAFDNAFERDENFRNALLRDVGHFFERTQGKSLENVPDSEIKLSMEYLLEELAVHAIFFKEYPCATIYPGRQQESFRLVREGLVADVPKGMTQSCYVPIFLYEITQGPVKPASANDPHAATPPRKQA